MPNTHIIVGTGVDSDVPKSVVLDSLKEVVLPGDTLVVPWVGGRPSAAMTFVYDFVVGTETPFRMIHDGASTVPSIFTDAEYGEVQNVPTMHEAYASMLSPGGYALVIGEDETTETWLLDTFSAGQEQIKFTDIARGMVPISIGPDSADAVDSEIEIIDISEEAAQWEAVPKDPANDPADEQFTLVDSDPTDTSVDKSPEERADIYSFSREEMENIPERVLKNIAERAWGVGADVPTHVPGIIAKVLDTQQMRKQEAEFTAKAEVPIDEVGTIAATYDLLMTLLRRAHEDDGARHLALALTNLEQSALWYYYHDAPGLTGE
jgi:hypothetical protein